MAMPSPISMSPGVHPKPPALPLAARPPVLHRGGMPAQRELPLRPPR